MWFIESKSICYLYLLNIKNYSNSCYAEMNEKAGKAGVSPAS